MRAGTMSELLTIQSVTATSDGQGGTSASAPATVAQIWAQPVLRGAAELMQAESVGSHSQFVFRARVRAGITAGMTAVWTPRFPRGMAAMTLQILGVQPEPSRDGMLITCAVVE